MQGSATSKEPIAIIGMGCRYPQAASVDDLWRLLVEGRDAIAPYPGSRFPELDEAYSRTAAEGSPFATHLGGFLPNVDRFDASFFGISPREAAFIDPQQRLLLEVSWEALEDAGQVRERYQGSRTGVFTGLWTTDYENHNFRHADRPDFYLLTGGGRSTVCGRISFTYGFEGPSVSVDTACSSSMVAIHLACQSLRQEECDMALAGGVNIILSSDYTRLFTNAGMLAPDGHCKFGDQAANGFVRSEGAGMVVLKRLSDAVACGDAIYAVIRGSSVNNDGKSGGLMVTPSRDGQRAMLLSAWRQAGIGGSDLSYIEVHGTGTHVGDPVEIGAICDALLESRTTERGTTRVVPLGSMKSNIGHTESAAGVAGVVKTALVLHHGILPASLHHETPNPDIDWEQGSVEVVSQMRALPASTDGKPRFAGASSFGLTGTNAHIVLQEYPRHECAPNAGSESDSSDSCYLLPISAYTSDALKENARYWERFLGQEISKKDLPELSWTAGERRTPLAHRFVALGADVADLQTQFAAFAAGRPCASPEAGTASAGLPRVVFVAPGQGSQWDGMARELFQQSPVFRESFLACDQAISRETGWSLIDRLEAPEAAASLTEIDFVQPALFAMSVALAAVWRSAGVVPAAITGHSMGEVAAAHLAGILTLEDAAAVICRRSRLMRTLSGSGAMASIELPASELGPWLEPFAGQISIAAENSPGTTVVAGSAEAIDQLLEWLELKEVFCRRIKVDVASHSAQVDSILPALAEELATLQPQPGSLPFFSTVQAAFTPGETLDADYWVRNLRQPVRLAESTTTLADQGHSVFIELSPHPVLIPALEATLRRVATSADQAIALPSLLRAQPAMPSFLSSLGRFWVYGGAVDWTALNHRQNTPASHHLRLPGYPFERERFWPEDAEGSAKSTRDHAGARLSPLLLSRTDPANEPGIALFTVLADVAALPYLNDHRVGGAIVFPAAGHLEVALEAGALLAPQRFARVEDVSFDQALYLSESEPTDVQLVLRRIPGKAESFTFSIMGRQGSGEAGWTQHSTGTLHLDEFRPSLDSSRQAFLEGESSSGSGTAEEHYRQAMRSGLQYGPSFQQVESFVSGHTAIGPAVRTRIALPNELRQPGYQFHPALLDCCFQAMIHLRPQGAGTSLEDVYLPMHVNKLNVLGAPSKIDGHPPTHLITEAIFVSSDARASTVTMDLLLKTESGESLAILEGMVVQRIKGRDADAIPDLFAMGWKELPPLPAPTPGSSAGSHWLIFADAPAPVGIESYAASLAHRHASLAGRSTLVWLGETFRPLGAGERRLDLLGADEYEIPLDEPTAIDTLLSLVAAEAGRISHVFDLWTLPENSSPASEANALEQLMRAQSAGTKFLPLLAQAITRAGWADPPRVWLLTAGTQNLPGSAPAANLAGSPVWGFGGTLSREHPELRPSLIDLSASAPSGPDPAEIESVVRLVLQQTRKASQPENRIAFRGKLAYAARITPCPRKTDDQTPRNLAPGEAFRVEIDHPGSIDQLRLRAVAKTAPAAGEVAIEIAFGGLNFIDVTKALDIYPGLDPDDVIQMGGECSGRIVAVGLGVEKFKVGDAVVALTPSPTRIGLLASHTCVPASLVTLVPRGLSLADAASLPIAYLTAHYALNHLGRLAAGEWVLIHAGAGGVGLAAARIALAQGARVIATASSPAKHAFLRTWGVEHVLQSRTFDFGEGVMEITKGRGVDIVLNSLAGDFISASLAVLGPYGRFIELGKRDIYADRRVGLKAFRRNIAYFAVDLAAWIEDKPQAAADMLREIMSTIDAGQWSALPVRTFPASEAIEAFQFMAQGRHIGKLALGFDNVPALQVLPAKIDEAAPLFRSDGTYMLTGAMGGVGAAVAEWMAQQGAGHLVLVSRRATGPAEEEILRRVREKGAVAEHHRTDLLDLDAVEHLMRTIAADHPPLRGIFHAAAVIDDALIENMTPDRFDSVFAPKIRGTWHLHQASLGLPLDYFVLFSSLASVFPAPGHGSYAAANSFMDAFAGYRRSLGLPACSINWAGWIGMGLAREAGTSQTITAYEIAGLGSFGREAAVKLLGEALRANPVQVVAVRIDAEKLMAAHDGAPPLFREVAGQADFGARASSAANAAQPHLAELATATSFPEVVAILEGLLRTETSHVLKLAPERITSTQPFGQLGIDSLMALELIRRVNADLGLALPATAVFNYPSIALLSIQLAKRLGLEEASGGTTSQPRNGTGKSSRLDAAETKQATSSLPAAQESLSEDEALRALMGPLMEPLTESGDVARGD